MDQVKALNFTNNVAFLSLEKGIFKSQRKASLDMHAPLFFLQHSWVHHIPFQLQRQKTVFADNLLFSLVMAAGSLGPADKLKRLMASPSKQPLFCQLVQCVLPGSPCCFAQVGRVRGQEARSAMRQAAPTQHLCPGARPEAVPLFLLSRSIVQVATYKSLPCACWCALAAIFWVKERSSSHDYILISLSFWT